MAELANRRCVPVVKRPYILSWSEMFWSNRPVTVHWLTALGPGPNQLVVRRGLRSANVGSGITEKTYLASGLSRLPGMTLPGKGVRAHVVALVERGSKMVCR